MSKISKFEKVVAAAFAVVFALIVIVPEAFSFVVASTQQQAEVAEDAQPSDVDAEAATDEAAESASEGPNQQNGEGSEVAADGQLEAAAASEQDEDAQDEDDGLQTLAAEDDYIYFDLAAGNVTINGSNYTGYIFKTANGTTTKQTITGTASGENKYYIYQSTEANKAITGLVDDKMTLPQYDAMQCENKAWSEYITNNSSVEDVISNWGDAAKLVDRTACENHIAISGNKNVDVVFDSLWSSYAPNSNSDGPVKVSGLSNDANVTVRLKGDSRFRNIYYNNNDANKKSKLTISSADGDGQTSGSMTVAAYVTELVRDNSGNWPDCLAVIGAANNAEYGLTFSGGTVFAGFPAQTNRVWDDRADVAFAECVGGGNNKPGEVTVNGGRLTAVTNGTSPAIGGGGGYNLTGDPGYVYITDGEVYAYSFGIYSIKAGRLGFVPTTAIGGASTFEGVAKTGTTVEISGGYVYASSIGGTAIGGGGSRNGTGGDATVNISGNAVVEAYSVASDEVYTKKDKFEKTSVSAGNAIGGGVGTTGGKATVTISGGTIKATAIGGGTAKDSAKTNSNSTSGNGGAATVTISGGKTNLTTGIGGGDSESAVGGAATVIISGGSTTAGKYIGGGTGGAKGGEIEKANGGDATIYITNGYIHTGIIGGGDTDSTSASAGVGYARAYISGGDIQGQFLLKGDDNTGNCEFIMTGGTIHDVNALNDAYTGLRQPNGGAVWMDDDNGIVTISGGTISNCSALSGGAVYMTAGTFTLTGDAKIKGCSATGDSDDEKNGVLGGRGGAVYLGGGRAVVGVDRRLVKETDETVKNEIQPYLGLEKADDFNAPLTTKEISLSNSDPSKLKCSISGCSAAYGGALYVAGYTDSQKVTVSEDLTIPNASINPQNYNVYVSAGTLEDNTAAESGGAVCVNNGHVLMDGGTITANKATTGNGGAIYLSSQANDEARVRVRSGQLTNNAAGKRGGAIAVEGQKDTSLVLKVVIGVNESHYKETNVREDAAAALITLAEADGESESVTSGVEYVGCDHINDGDMEDDDCPVVKGNTAAEMGGAVYITGGKTTYLNIYCLDESGNSAENDKDSDLYDHQSDFLMVEGGTVIITTGDKSENLKAEEGHSKITGSIHITGGSLDIYGHMVNPLIEGIITVDLQSESDHFEDHRVYIPGVDGEKYYTIQYWENFPLVDENGDPELGSDNKQVRTGRFRQFTINPDKEGGYSYTHEIISSLFVREGYEIRGWNTDSEGLGNWYAVGEIYQFNEDDEKDIKRTIQTHEENGEQVSDLISNDTSKDNGSSELTTLVLYAIWNSNSYTVSFEANSPTGKYSGSMTDQVVVCGKDTPLKKNEYIVEGYVFDGWVDSEGNVYEDEEEISNLAAAGGEVTLRARWKLCTHEVNDGATYSYSSQTVDDTHTALVATCSCGGYSEKLMMSADDATYDGLQHGAVASFSTSAAGSVDQDALKSGLKEVTENDIVYTRTAKIWSTGNKTVEEPVGGKPENAGIYEAKVTLGDAGASVTYKINKANQVAPNKPTYEVSDVGDIVITPGKGDVADKTYEYAISYYVEDSGYSDPVWGEDSTIKLTENQTTYVAYIRYAEDENYYASPATKADTAFYFAGNIKFILVCEEGIDVYAVGDESTTTSEEDPITKVTITAWVKDGYYLISSDGFKVEHETELTDGNDSSDQPNWGTPTKNTSPQRYTEIYECLNIPENSITTVTISGVRKAPVVVADVIDGQEFGGFDSVATTITKDSAFTVRFSVSSFWASDYGSQRLSFDKALPDGATIILISDNAYYYYCVGNDGGGVKEIDLTEFTAMGGTEKFSYSATDGDATDYSEFAYQFVVDFSQVKEGARLKSGDLGIDLELSPNTSTLAPTIPSDGVVQASVGLADVAEFELSSEVLGETTATISGSVGALKGAASIWENRKSSIVLTTSASLPEDLCLKVTHDGNTEYVYRTRQSAVDSSAPSMFIIPVDWLTLPTKAAAVGSLDFNVELCSSLFESGGTYDFAASWYVADSEAAHSPLNGDAVATDSLTFKVVNDTPSVKVYDITGGTGRIVDGSVQKLVVGVKFSGLPEGATVKADILRKMGDTYVSYGYNATVASVKSGEVVSGSALALTGGADAAGVYEGTYSPSIKNVVAGNAYLELKVVDADGKTIVGPAKYYFYKL